MEDPRVAVIAVHGVADQAAGATAQAIVELLVSSPPAGAAYRAVSSADVTMPVAPLAPRAPASTRVAATAHGADPRCNATPKGEDRSVGKAFAQSLRSDFHHAGWQAPPQARPMQAVKAALLPDVSQACTSDTDRGIEVTSYLLTKHIDNGARQESYSTTRIELSRGDTADAARPASRVDVYEMYWADLSRLSGAVPRIVSELFTMVFRLSKLGRETVEEMRGALDVARATDAPRARLYRQAWACTSALQSVLDWMLVNGLALLFTQLAWLAILFIAFGLVTNEVMPPMRDKGLDLHVSVAVAVAVAAAMRFLYSAGDRDDNARGPISFLVFAFAASCPFWGPGLLPWFTVIVLLAIVTLLNETVLRIADDRFPFVHVVGRWMWIATMTLMLASAVLEYVGTGNGWRPLWVHATMFVTEVVLFAVKWWWIVVGVLLLPWFVGGLVAAREAGYASRGSVATGRLGFALSLCMFIAVTMSTWAMLNGALYWSVKGNGYTPCLFAIDARTLTDTLPDQPARVARLPVNACLVQSDAAATAAARWKAGSDTIPTAEFVLQNRYERSTALFSLLAVLLVGLLLYLATMFVPSILAELKLLLNRTRDAFARHVEGRARSRADRAADSRAADAAAQSRDVRARELGRWLTAGYRGLDPVVLAFTTLGALMCAFIAASFADSLFGFMPDRQWFVAVEAAASDASQVLLKPLIFSAAGLGAALTLFGGALSRYLPALRAPLDVALDVDNHFREFPRTNIARAHIFSRYAALLDHVARQGYDRIVIVSHSQGTVISTELLRFLSSRHLRAPTPRDKPTLGTTKVPEINLLTVGCPLRQLYAARFPGLYAWVLANNGAVFGPRATDIGVQRWMNAFCSGDYVGRWLWSKATPETSLSHPMVNLVAQEPFGRQDVFTGFNPAPPADLHLHVAREVEVCLGLGAHTHYFERDQATVAWMIDYLIRAPRP